MVGKLLALGLCVCLVHVAASVKFVVITPNLFYINETTDIAIIKHNIRERQSTVTVTLENKSNGRVKTDTHYVRTKPKHVGIQVEESMVGVPDSSGRLYVRLKVECQNHGFSQQMDVLVSRRTGIVYLQTDKPIYAPNQTVIIRVYTLHKDKTPSDVPVRIDIINPHGAILQRQDVHTSQGLVNTTFHISDLPVLGEWSVMAYYGHALTQEKKVAFTVNKHVLPHFEVRLLDVTDYIINSTTKVSGKVKARYSFDADVDGHTSVTLWLVRNGTATRVTDPTTRQLRNGEAVFSFNMSTLIPFLDASIQQLAHEQARLQVEAIVTEEASGLIEEAVNNACLFSQSPYIISTDGVPRSITPGLPLDFSIGISYPNGKVSPNTDVTANLGSGGHTRRTNEHGVAYFTFDMGRNVQDSVRLEVEVKDADTEKILSGKEIYLPKNNMTEQIKVVQADRTREVDASGERDTTLRVQFDRNKDQQLKIYLALISGDRLKVTDRDVEVGMREVTFNPRILPRMAPEVRAVAWYVKDSGEIVTHSTHLKVTRICGHETKISPESEDYKSPGDDLRLSIESTMGSKVALLAVDTSVYFLSNKDRLSREKVFDGFASEDLGCGGGGGATAAEVFSLSGLAVLSDASINTPPRTSENCGTTSQRKTRRAVGSQPAASCDTHNCCADGKSYAATVDISHPVNIDSTCRRMTTNSSCNVTCKNELFTCCAHELADLIIRSLPAAERTGHTISTKYPTAFKMYTGDIDVRSDFPESFLLKTIDMITSGKALEMVKLPDSVTTWSLQAVSMAGGYGMCVSKPYELLVKKDLFLKVHLPYEAVLGEQLELLATVYNTITYSTAQPRVEVTLSHTDDLCYEKEERPQSSIPVGGSKTFRWTVIPKRVGEIKLRLTMTSTRNSDSVQRILRVVPPGVQESPLPVCLTLNPQQHISYSSREHSVNYTVRTTPAEKKQTFQFNLGAPAEASDDSHHRLVLGLEGGVMAEVVDAYLHGVEHYVKEAVGCGEQTMARLGPSLSAAHYIRHTRQAVISANATDTIKTGIQRMMSFRSKSGAFGMYKNETGGTHLSLWLTAFTSRMLSIAQEFSEQMQDDPSDIICGAVQWLMAQNKQNLFDDDRGLPHIWSLTGTDKTLALTAYVVLAVKESGCIQPQSDNGKLVQQTLDNLAGHVRSISRPYTLAVITYTLAKTGHRDARSAYRRLLSFATEVKGAIPVQRQWRQSPSKTTQEDVETTAYGVLAQLTLGHLTHSQPYVRWLLTQRRADGLFKTTQTTVVGLQALTEYSINTTRHNVNFTCSLTSRTTRSINQICQISGQSVKRKIDVAPAVGGRLDVECQGEGIGQLTLESSYYTDRAQNGTERGFNITAVQSDKTVRNFYGTIERVPRMSTVTVCTRMRRTQDRCGHAVVDVGLATGYEATTDSLDQVLVDHPSRQADHPSHPVDTYRTHCRSVRFYVPTVPHESELCVSFDVKCQHQVNNLQPVAVSVYDYYEPDRLRNVIFYHPKSKENNPDSIGRCVSNACPACHGYGANDKAPLDHAGLRARATLNAYVFKAKWKEASNHEDNAIVFEIKHVGKRGTEDPREVRKSTITFRLPEGCSRCRNLVNNGRYLIMGKEQRTTTGVQYMLDDKSYIIQINAPRPQTGTLWDDQKRFCTELRLCRKWNNHGI